ncbi:hypothetical protein INR49_010654 [Caranx melampygus]|nr:hypothetical protein INR49_010654 [Caranx melampygus]
MSSLFGDFLTNRVPALSSLCSENGRLRVGQRTEYLFNILETQMPGPTQALSPNGENNNDIVPDNGTNIIPYRKNTVRGERAYRSGLKRCGLSNDRRTQTAAPVAPAAATTRTFPS